MYQVTATTTTLPLMVSSSVASVTTSVTMHTSTISFSSAGCGSAAMTDSMEQKGCCWPYHCAAAAATVPDAFSGICQFDMGPPQVSISFTDESPTDFSICVGVW